MNIPHSFEISGNDKPLIQLHIQEDWVILQWISSFQKHCFLFLPPCGQHCKWTGTAIFPFIQTHDMNQMSALCVCVCVCVMVVVRTCVQCCHRINCWKVPWEM